MFASFNARAVGLATLDAATTIDLAAEAGFSGVDLLVRDLIQSGDDPRSLRSRMDDHGLQGGAFPCPVDWRGEEKTFRRDIKALDRLAEVAASLGLTRTGTWVMPELPKSELSRSQIAAQHINRIGAIARILDPHGIRFGLEVIGVESFRSGQTEPFITRISEIDREIKPIWDEAPNLGILADVFHLYAADELIDAALVRGIEFVIWAHVADLPAFADPERSEITDANRGLPGENGAIDIRAFLSRLAQENYQGPVTVEPLANCKSLQGRPPCEVARLVKASLAAVWPPE